MTSKELRVAIEAAEEAGRLLMKHYGKVSAKYKTDKSVVTEADVESEKRIKSILKKQFPEYSFVGEETGYGERKSGYVWIVDPLDGTTNYKMMNPFFGISVALVYEDSPVLGVVNYPCQKEVFYAEREKGAFLNRKKIHVSNENDIEKSILTFCHGRDKSSVKKMINIFGKLKLINNKVRQIGAAALELCYVACGRTESFFMVGVNPWDVAAGTIVVREANGLATDFDGKDFTVSSKNILASNGKIHGRLIELLK